MTAYLQIYQMPIEVNTGSYQERVDSSFDGFAFKNVFKTASNLRDAGDKSLFGRGRN